MTESYVAQGCLEDLWDIPRLIEGAKGLAVGASGTFELQPTALQGAAWAVNTTGILLGLFSVKFSTDTAIAWQLFTAGADPGLTARTKYVTGVAGSAVVTFEAQVAAPAHLSAAAFNSGYCAPGGPYELLAPGWLLETGQAIVLYTDVVVANCWATFQWIEMNP